VSTHIRPILKKVWRRKWETVVCTVSTLLLAHAYGQRDGTHDLEKRGEKTEQRRRVS
jgi:hypothetical protein